MNESRISIMFSQIQPIVENAVKHGIGKKEGGGAVTISTKETAGDYQVIITDDGVGFDSEKIADDGQQVSIALFTNSNALSAN